MDRTEVREIDIRYKATGVMETIATLNRLVAAEEGVVVVAEKIERSDRSLERSLGAIQGRYVEHSRLIKQVNADMNALHEARARGIVDENAYGAALDGMRAKLAAASGETQRLARETAAYVAERKRAAAEIAQSISTTQATYADRFGYGRGRGTAQSSASAFETAYIIQERDRAEAAASERAARVQAGFTQQFGIGREARSAESSAFVFETMAREAEEAERRIKAAADQSSAAWARMSRGSLDAVNPGVARLNASADASAKLANMGRAAEAAGKRAGLASHQWTNLSFQLNDAATMAASGSSVFQIVATQAGQVFQALQDGPRGVVGSLKEIGGAALGLLTPLNMVMAGIVAVPAAIAYMGTSGRREIASLDDVFKRHADTIRTLKDLYGSAAAGLKELKAESPLVIQVLAQVNLRDLRENIDKQRKDALAQMGTGGFPVPATDAFGMPTGMDDRVSFTVASRFGAFEKEIKELEQFGDVLKFRDEIMKRMASGGLSDYAKEAGKVLISTTDDLSASIRRLDSASQAASGTLKGIIGTPEWVKFLDEQRSAYQEGRAQADQNEARRAAAYRFDMRLIGARSPADRAAIEADRVRDEAGQDPYRSRYADAEATRAASLIRAQAAEDDRRYREQQTESRTRDLVAQQAELAGIGQTAEAQDRLRREVELTTEARRRAYELTGDYNNAELAGIRELAAADAARRDQIRRANFERGLADDRAELFDPEAGFKSRVRSAGFDPESTYGQHLVGIQRTTEALRELRETGRDAWDTIFDRMSAGDSPMKAIGAGLKGMAADMSKKAWSNAYESIWSSVGDAFPGLKGILPGGKRDGSSPASALYVTLGGGADATGLLGGAANDIFGRAANTNKPLSAALPQIPGTTADGLYLPSHTGLTAGMAAPAASGGYADMIRQSATRYGIDPNVAIRVAQSEGGLTGWRRAEYVNSEGYREPSYGPFQALVGGKGTGFPTGQGNSMLAAGIDPRDPANAQAVIDWQMRYASQNGWGEWYGAAKAGISNRQGIGANSVGIASPMPSLQAANQNLEQFSKTAADSTGNLGTFGQGLGQFGSALGSAPAGGAGGGGIMSSLLSGIGGIVGKVFGFEEGGYTGGKRGKAAGIVHGEEYVFDASATAQIGVDNLDRMRRAGRPAMARPQAVQTASVSRTYRGGDVIVQGNVTEDVLPQVRKMMAQNNAEMERRIRYDRENEWRAA